MARNKIYMNEVRPPKGHPDREMLDRLDMLVGARPLDGTNLEYLYKKERQNMCLFGDGDGTAETIDLGPVLLYKRKPKAKT